MRLCALCALLLFSAACDTDGQDTPGATAEVWLTSGDQRFLLAQQDDILITDDPPTTDVRVTVDPSETDQPMEGFGAAMTNSAAWLIDRHPQREDILRRLFSVEDGIGLSYVRVPMGASDFAAEPPRGYTYHDLPAGEADPSLATFSIDVDRPFVIPALLDAQRLRPELKLMATPWSAPAWMKSPETLNGGSLRSDAYPAFAEYFARFLEAYREAGLEIDALTVQNEPQHASDDYPTMRMTARSQATFIKDHLGPLLQARGLPPQILAWDHNWDEPEYPLAVLNDPEANAFVAGTAWHCYAGTSDAQARVRRAHPDKGIYFTECSGGAWDPNFESAMIWNLRNVFIGAVRNGARTVLLWNLALDENNGPFIGGCTNCRGVTTLTDTDVSYEV
ncbi:MAG: glycosyl hydrolase, partial [Bacteroidota bacterium]